MVVEINGNTVNNITITIKMYFKTSLRSFSFAKMWLVLHNNTSYKYWIVYHVSR